MQPVDVLGDDVADDAAPDECRDGQMAAVGFGRGHRLVRLDLAAPGLAARLDRGDEVLIIDRLEARPDPARAAEVRNAGFRADARPGEDHGEARTREHHAPPTYRRAPGDRKSGGEGKRE